MRTVCKDGTDVLDFLTGSVARAAQGALATRTIDEGAPCLTLQVPALRLSRV